MESELEKAWRDFLFEFGYSFGFIWVVNRLPWLRLKSQYQSRLDSKLKGE